MFQTTNHCGNQPTEVPAILGSVLIHFHDLRKLPPRLGSDLPIKMGWFQSCSHRLSQFSEFPTYKTQHGLLKALFGDVYTFQKRIQGALVVPNSSLAHPTNPKWVIAQMWPPPTVCLLVYTPIFHDGYILLPLYTTKNPNMKS